MEYFWVFPCLIDTEPRPPRPVCTSLRFYLEPADEVVSRKQLVEYELQGMVSAGLVESKHVEGPFVNVLGGGT